MQESKKSNVLAKIVLAPILGYIVGNLITYFYTFQKPLFAQLYLVFKHNQFDVPYGIYGAYFLFVLISLSPLAYLFRSEKNKYGSAKIATLEEIKSPRKLNLIHEDGIFLGRAFKKDLFLKEALSILILAPPGTGKTSAVVIPQLILNDTHSAVIHDPKGELLKMTSKHRSNFSKIVVFDPADKNSSPFNALDNSLLHFDEKGEPDLSKSRKHIENVATVLMPHEGTGDKYWVSGARSLFVYLAMWILWKDKKVNIPEVSRILAAQDDVKKVLKLMQSGVDPRIDDTYDINDLTPDEELRYKMLLQDAQDEDLLSKKELEELASLKLRKDRSEGRENIESDLPKSIHVEGNKVMSVAKADNQWTGVRGSFDEALAVFNDETVASNTTEGCAFTAKQLRREKTSLYVIVRDEDKERLSTLTALLFEVLANQLSSKMPEDDDLTVTFFLDEFVRLGKLNAIKELPAISRGYRANVVFIAQEYDQITDRYGDKAANVFNSTTAVKIVFRQNNRDAAEKISQTIGNKTVIRKSESADKTKMASNKKSESTSEEGIRLFSDQDIMNLDKNKCIILVQGFYKRPIYGDVAYWFNDKNMKKTINDNLFKINDTDENGKKIEREMTLTEIYHDLGLREAV